MVLAVRAGERGGVLSDILKPQEEPPREEQRSERALLWDTRPEFGWRPWCRVCHKPVAGYRLECHAGNVTFDVQCHGATMGGTLPANMPWDQFRLEVFCAEEPHMELISVWWVATDGGELQMSKAAIAAMPGGIFNGPFGRWCREKGYIWISGAMIGWSTWWALHGGR